MTRYVFQITGALVAIAYLILGIVRSTNSTAVIGFLFIPVAAAFGAFVGDAIKYIWDLLRKKRPHSVGKTLLILAVSGFCAYKYILIHVQDEDVRLAESPATPGAELVRLLHKNDARVLHGLAANPSLPEENLQQMIDAHLTDYYIMSGVVLRPSLSVARMERIVALERRDFNDDAEYEVYQSQVWAPLAKRKDIPEALVHKLAGKKSPEYFLILALVDLPSVSCAEKQSFLPQTNQVLESTIRRSMQAQNCGR